MKSALQRILVPIDFSELTPPAIETAQALAQKFGATVHLVYVHQFYYPGGFTTPAAPLPMPIATYDDDAIARESRDLQLLAKRYALRAENCHLLTGSPVFDELCRFAKELPADLIVMPTHCPTGLDRFLEGSTAERVVQHSPCPVFVARARARKAKRKAVHGEIDSILVPVDFSHSSFKALECAIEFAERVAARLIVFHAVQIGWALAGGEPGVYDLAPLRARAREEAAAQMDRFVRRAKFRGVGFETVVRVGSPVVEICAFAEQRDVDLIITATHGRTGFAHLLIGSVAEQVVRHAGRPVLVVPSHPETRTAGFARKVQSPSRRAGPKKAPRSQVARERVTRKDRKLAKHAFPERRKTNKYRESHAA